MRNKPRGLLSHPSRKTVGFTGTDDSGRAQRSREKSEMVLPSWEML